MCSAMAEVASVTNVQVICGLVTLGTLPSILSNFKSLMVLSVNNNNLSGKQMLQRYLHIAMCGLLLILCVLRMVMHPLGTIPLSFGQLSMLEMLYLLDNSLTGTQLLLGNCTFKYDGIALTHTL